jgi:hypothetical protein
LDGRERQLCRVSADESISRLLKSDFNAPADWAADGLANHAHCCVLDFGSAAKTTLFASDVEKRQGQPFSTSYQTARV